MTLSVATLERGSIGPMKNYFEVWGMEERVTVVYNFFFTVSKHRHLLSQAGGGHGLE